MHQLRFSARRRRCSIIECSTPCNNIHNIQLDQNIYLGNVDIINSITPSQAKKVYAIKYHESIKLATINNIKSAVKPIEEILSAEKTKYSHNQVHWLVTAVIVH